MAETRTYKARGIVLRARNLGEADRIVTFFSLERGKLDAVAKGIRRARSKMGGRLEFANEVGLALHRGRTLDVISSAELLSERWNALVEPDRFAVAATACEIVDALCELEMALPGVYELLRRMLDATARSMSPRSLLPRFSMRILGELGVAPPLDACIRCASALTETAWLDAEAGGLIDAACREKWRELPALDAAALESLRSLRAPRGERARVEASPQAARATEQLVAHHVGRRLRAPTILSS
ncbi:MAG: DNA repair protein RecO [Candidatus Tyrphobacter sp.]